MNEDTTAISKSTIEFVHVDRVDSIGNNQTYVHAISFLLGLIAGICLIILFLLLSYEGNKLEWTHVSIVGILSSFVALMCWMDCHYGIQVLKEKFAETESGRNYERFVIEQSLSRLVPILIKNPVVPLIEIVQKVKCGDSNKETSHMRFTLNRINNTITIDHT